MEQDLGSAWKIPSSSFCSGKDIEFFLRGGRAGRDLPNLNKPCQNCWTLCEVYMPNLLLVICLELFKKCLVVGGWWLGGGGGRYHIEYSDLLRAKTLTGRL